MTIEPLLIFLLPIMALSVIVIVCAAVRLYRMSTEAGHRSFAGLAASLHEVDTHLRATEARTPSLLATDRSPGGVARSVEGPMPHKPHPRQPKPVGLKAVGRSRAKVPRRVSLAPRIRRRLMVSHRLPLGTRLLAVRTDGSIDTLAYGVGSRPI